VRLHARFVGHGQPVLRWDHCSSSSASAEHLDKLQSPRPHVTSAGFVSFIQLFDGITAMGTLVTNLLASASAVWPHGQATLAHIGAAREDRGKHKKE
jgi:hypothetical protein